MKILKYLGIYVLGNMLLFFIGTALLSTYSAYEMPLLSTVVVLLTGPLGFQILVGSWIMSALGILLYFLILYLAFINVDRSSVSKKKIFLLVSLWLTMGLGAFISSMGI